MSNIFNNPVWPNGMQIDDEGYAVFYPLGTNKIPIPTTASDWPEGSKLIFPFVYDENDELVDFCDTKAMEIDNNNTVIDMPYTDIKADFSSIIEGTLTINTPSDSNVKIKWGSVDKVLTDKIEKVVGRGNCKVSFDKVANKVVVAVALDTTESQLAEVESLLNRVLPRNLVTEFDPLPMGFTKVEHLESTGTQRFCTEIIPKSSADFETEVQVAQTMSGVFGQEDINYKLGYNFKVEGSKGYFRCGKNEYSVTDVIGERITFKKENWKLYYRNTIRDLAAENESFTKTLYIMGRNGGAYSRFSHMKMWYFKFDNGDEKLDMIPALDPTGAPCMFDLVTKTPFYNNGTGDFMYPGAEQAVQTTDLDAKSYAKLTEHGVRRLYHVPKGYTGSMDEYAAANGFKELVEPPAPLEGYWTPEWRETETQLICDWVETEPPVEKEIQ